MVSLALLLLIISGCFRCSWADDPGQPKRQVPMPLAANECRDAPRLHVLVLADLLDGIPLVHSQYTSTILALRDVAAMGGLRAGPAEPGVVKHLGCRESSLRGIQIVEQNSSTVLGGTVGFVSDLILYSDYHHNDLLAVFGPSTTLQANRLSVVMESAPLRSVPWFTYPDLSLNGAHTTAAFPPTVHLTLRPSLDARVTAAVRMLQTQPAFDNVSRVGLVHLADDDLGSAVAASVQRHFLQGNVDRSDLALARLISLSLDQSMSVAMGAMHESGLHVFFVAMGLQGTESFLRAAQVAGLARDTGYLFIFLQEMDDEVLSCTCAEGHLWLGISGPGNQPFFDDYAAEVIGPNSPYLDDSLRLSASLGPAGGAAPTTSDAIAVDQVRAFMYALNYTLSIAGLDPYSDEGRASTLWALSHLQDLPPIEYLSTEPGVAPPVDRVYVLQAHDEALRTLDAKEVWADDVLPALVDYRPDSCAAGPLFYRDAEGRACVPCPAGRLNVPGDGRDMCDSCAIGSVLSGSSCVPCPIGSGGYLRDDGVADCDDGIDILVLLVTILSLTIVCALICIPFRLMQLRREQDLALAVVAKEREAVDDRSRFLSVVSHELRSPLQIVTLNAEMLSERWDEGNTDPSILARYVKGILSASTTLKRCVNQLLDLFKLDSMSSGPPEVAEFDLRELCESCTNAIEVEALGAGKDVEVFTFIDADDLHVNVLGDEGHLRQVLMNLLHNAVKFTETGYVCLMVKPTGPPAHVRRAAAVDMSFSARIARATGWGGTPRNSSRSDTLSHGSMREDADFTPNALTDLNDDRNPGWWRISVLDTGCGVAKEQESRLFKEFSQVHGHTVNRLRVEHGGTGLGLFISRRITTFLGGTIGYRPNSPVGSVFELKVPLPIAVAPSEERNVPLCLPSIARQNVGESLLLTACKLPELCEAISMLAGRMLPTLSVLVASNAADLTALARKLPDDARVMVLAEEDMFNPTLLHLLASRPVTRITLRDAFADQSTDAEHQSTHWLAKPVTASVLRSVLYNWQTGPAPTSTDSPGRNSPTDDDSLSTATRRKPRKRGRRQESVRSRTR